MLSKTKKILILNLVILTISHICLADALILPKEKPNLTKEVIKNKISKLTNNEVTLNIKEVKNPETNSFIVAENIACL